MNSLSYPWPEAFENWGLPADFAAEQWETLDDMMDAAMSEINELAELAKHYEQDN